MLHLNLRKIQRTISTEHNAEVYPGFFSVRQTRLEALDSFPQLVGFSTGFVYRGDLCFPSVLVPFTAVIGYLTAPMLKLDNENEAMGDDNKVKFPI